MHFDAAIYFPQWQGGPNPKGLKSGSEILHRALEKEFSFHTVHTNLAAGKRHDNIACFDPIVENLKQATTDLRELAPRTIFTQGGDCSIDVPIIDHLHGQYPGTLGVIWIDAHADIHTPESSASSYYHGMPLRALLGEGHPDILRELKHPLALSQICYAGIRSIDPPEQEYIHAHNLPVLTADAIDRHDYLVFHSWCLRGGIKHLHIHLDLDALDPDDNVSVTYHVEDGIRLEAMARFLRFLHAQNMTVGFTITEYAAKKPNPAEMEKILSLIDCVVPLRKILAA